jgi:hypothetical protein
VAKVEDILYWILDSFIFRIAMFAVNYLGTENDDL